MRNVILSGLLSLLSSVAFGGAAITFHGRILDPQGNAVNSGSVTFKIQVRSPGVPNCLLYEESRPVVMTDSDGVFVIPIGNGDGQRGSQDPGITIEKVFSNDSAQNFTSLHCNSGTAYQPAALDSRRLIVSFNDGTSSGDQALPSIDVNYVPFALHAEESSSALKVGTVPASQVMSVASGAATPLSAPNFAELMLLVNGNSASYVKTSALPSCGAGEVLKAMSGALVCVTDNVGTDSDLLAGISCPDGKILKRVAGAWACGDESGVGTETDPTVAAYAKRAPGAGLVVNGSNDLTVDFGTTAGKVAQGNDSRFTDSRAPNGAASGDLASNYPNPTVAKIRGVDIDTTAPLTGQVLKYDGTKWTPSTDAGVASELDPSVQAFAKNPVGSGLVVSSSQITVDFGTVAGKVAQGNDSRFTDARAPNGSATGDLAGSYPNPSVKAIRGNAVATTTPLNGQVYQWVNGSTEWQPKYMSFADLKKSDGTTQMPASCAANETLAWSAITDVFSCAAIGSLDASKITAGTIAYARLPVGTAASTVAAGDDSRFGNALKVVGTNINISSLTSGQVLKYDGANWVNAPDSGVGSELDPSVQQYAKSAPGTGLKVTSNQIVPDFGSGAGKVVEGNDARLSDTRVASDLNSVVSTGLVQRTGPGAFSTLGVSAPITNSGTNIGLAVGSGLTLNSGNLVPDFGATGGKVAQGNDARFPNATCASGNKMRWDGSAWQCEVDSSGSGQWVDGSGGAISYSGGKVGVGAAAPVSPLTVSAASSTSSTTPTMTIASDFTTAVDYTAPFPASTVEFTFKQQYDGLMAPAAQIKVSAIEDWRSSAKTDTQMQICTYHDGTQNCGLTISPEGRLGIGNSGPTAPLDVTGSAYLRSANGGILMLKRQDSTTTADEPLGSIYFGSTDGNIDREMIGGYAAEAWSSSLNGSYLKFSTTKVGENTSGERLRIDPSGNVGIGATVPGEKLEVAGNVKITGVGNGIKFPDGSTQLTAATSNGLPWNVITSATTATVGNAYMANSASSVAVTLPATCATGQQVQVSGVNTGGWSVVPGASQTIYTGAGESTTSAIPSNNSKDSIVLTCITANTAWLVTAETTPHRLTCSPSVTPYSGSSGTHSFSCTCSSLKIIAVGGGGGGRGIAGNSGGGGGGGGSAIKTITNATGSFSYSAGAGGAGGSSGGGVGTAGGTTTVTNATYGLSLTATGGNPGSGAGVQIGGTGGTGSGGDANYTGGSGGTNGGGSSACETGNGSTGVGYSNTGSATTCGTYGGAGGTGAPVDCSTGGTGANGGGGSGGWCSGSAAGAVGGAGRVIFVCN